VDDAGLTPILARRGGAWSSRAGLRTVVERAVATARRDGAAVWVSAQMAGGSEDQRPSATLDGLLATGEVVWAFRHPQGSTVVGLGTAAAFAGRGRGAWRTAIHQLRQFRAETRLDPSLKVGGGAAFRPGTGGWPGFADASLVLPRMTGTIHPDGSVEWTFVAHVHPQDDAGSIVDRWARWMAGGQDGHRAAIPPRVVRRRSWPSPAEWRREVATVVGAMAGGAGTKVVLARAVDVTFADAVPLAGVWEQLCGDAHAFVFLIRQPGGWLLGATPELLARVAGDVVETRAVAGTDARGAPPDHLMASGKDRREHDVVSIYIQRHLARVAETVVAEPTRVVAAGPVQHLVTPIHGRLKPGTDLAEVVDALHPTPAVAGDPEEFAMAWQDRLEVAPRGWYAGPVGLMDLAGGGAFYVALRSARVRGRTARLFAGCGLMGDSDAARELEESTAKLAVMMTALGADRTRRMS